MTGLELSWSSYCLRILEQTLKQCVTKKCWKSMFQSSKWNIQHLDKKRRKHCKSYHQDLHQRHHQHQFSNSIALWLICYPQQPESHQSHLQNRSQWQGQDRFFAPDPPPKFTSSVNISLCIVFRKDDFDSDTMAVAVCNFWMTKENNNIWICLFAINQASCHHLDREEHGKIPNSKFSISSKSTWVGQSHPAEQQRSTNEDGR